MPKGSIRNPGTKKTTKKRQYTAAYNRSNLADNSGAARKQRDEAYARLRAYDAEKAAAKSPRNGLGMENPFKALKRRAAAKKK